MKAKTSWLLVFPLLAGCANEGRWQRAREAYCQELELFANTTHTELGSIASSVPKVQEDPAMRGYQCSLIHRDLLVIAGRMQGFAHAQNVLAVARGAKESLAQAGFTAKLDVSPIQKYAEDLCLQGKLTEATAAVNAIDQTLASDFQQGLASCRAVGWKSALQN